MSVLTQKSINVFLNSSIAKNEGQLGASLLTFGTNVSIFFDTAIIHYCTGVDGLGEVPASTWFLIPSAFWKDWR